MPKPMRHKQTHIKKKRKTTTTTSQKNSTEKDFDKFRHEIYKFGLSGLDKKEQLDARVELAIKLGAKPKKWIKNCTGLGEDNKKTREKSSQNKQDGAIRETNKYIKANPSPST